MLYFSVGPKRRIWMNFAFSSGGGGWSVKPVFGETNYIKTPYFISGSLRGLGCWPMVEGIVNCKCPRDGVSAICCTN